MPGGQLSTSRAKKVVLIGRRRKSENEEDNPFLKTRTACSFSLMFITIMLLLAVVALEMKACLNDIQIMAAARISSSCSHIWFYQHNGPNAF